MFYCQVILFAGYILFFTESLIIFFFSYEMLLIPSFFILYKFAKTRRCIEAAYLMFFWTQLGALFLIFAFLYLFFIVGTSNFTNISNFYFSSFYQFQFTMTIMYSSDKLIGFLYLLIMLFSVLILIECVYGIMYFLNSDTQQFKYRCGPRIPIW
jgi:formate hydrogenlyase subunit 3/multisubunit Na+/H+ antiporter MnhD subunit